MSLAALDLSLIPAPSAILVVDHLAKVAEMKAQLIEALPSLAPVLALESEPLTKLVQVFAFEAILKANEINQSYRAGLLATAIGPDLDNVAANLAIARQEGETDDRFRARAALGPEGWASAGPIGAYLFHALSASAEVADVAVTSPEPGEVRVVVLSSADDGVADADLLLTVGQALNDDDVRPLTDSVTVVSATVESYDVTATIRILSGPDAGPIEALALAAVEAYAASRRRLGRGISRAGLYGALMRPGVEDATLTSPAADIEAEPDVAPVLAEIVLTVEVV